MKKKRYGENIPDKTILLIRPNSEDGVQGLMSLFIQTMRWYEFAHRKGYIPYVDFMNYKTQYYNGIDNVWEYFFKQNLCIDDVYRCKNVIITGTTMKKTIEPDLFREKIYTDKNLLNYCNSIIKNNINLTEEVKTLLKKEEDDLKIKKCLGVYIRGTDYIMLKPTGEYVQPSIEKVIFKIKEFLKKYNNPNIFLVTEDAKYYEILKNEFNDKLLIVSYDSFIKGYDGKDYLSKSGVLNPDRKKRGIEYLVKILLLSKCKYLISSITTGSLAAYSFNGGTYEDEYIFNLGMYE